MNKDLLKKLDAMKGKPKSEYTKEQDEVILLSRTPEYSITYPNLVKFFSEQFGIKVTVGSLKFRYYKLKEQGR